MRVHAKRIAEVGDYEVSANVLHASEGPTHLLYVRKYMEIPAFLKKKDGDTGSAVCNTRFAKVYDNQG